MMNISPIVNSVKCTVLVCFTTHYSQPYYAGLNFEIWEIAAVWPSHLQASLRASWQGIATYKCIVRPRFSGLWTPQRHPHKEYCMYFGRGTFLQEYL